jgi:acetate---CoA ligase (ADP-forming)
MASEDFPRLERVDMTVVTELNRLFRPDSVAIVGASPQKDSPRNKIVRVLLKHGFQGRVYPVSPTHAEVEGLKAYKAVGDLPEVPDVALVITPAHTVPGVIAECGAKGIRNAIVFSAGFEETEAGKEHALRLAEAARNGNVTVLGPNCQGIWSVKHRSMLTYSPAAMNLETLLYAPIAVISQSGALAGAIGNSLQRRGIGVSYLVSVGNETCVDALDMLSRVIEQDDVRVVALYVEGLNRGERLLRIAERARERGIQIVVLKSGRSTLGQEATASHTGKIASPHAVYTGVLEQAGVILLDSLASLLLAVEVLGFCKDPRVNADPRGGISVLSSSGGAGALLADHCSELGVPMAEFSSETATRLKELLPHFARSANPIDLTGQINTVANLFRDTCLAIAADPRTQAVVVQYASSGRKYLIEDADTFKTLARETPVIVSFVGETMEADVQRAFRESGVLLASDPSVTVQALSLLYARRRMLAMPPALQRKRLTLRKPPHAWNEVMKYCEEGGVTPAKWVILRATDRAAQACAALNYPVVVKVLPSEAEHKTELGLVKLRVNSPEEVDGHAAEFRRKLAKPDAGILVQEMITGGVEVVLSCLRKTDFGPVISIGTGGMAIELYRDVAHLKLPVTAEQVVLALSKLKLWALLQGFRGAPRADVEALALVAERIGDLFLATPDVQEFELNPLIVGTRGQGVRAVDALIAIAPTTQLAGTHHQEAKGALAPA